MNDDPRSPEGPSQERRPGGGHGTSVPKAPRVPAPWEGVLLRVALIAVAAVVLVGAFTAALLAQDDGAIVSQATLTSTPEAPATTESPSPSPSTSSPTPSQPSTPTHTPRPGCPTDWSADQRAIAGTVTQPLAGVRAGQHDCHDRLVVDLVGVGVGYEYKYVDRLVAPDSGEELDLRGDATLQITINAPLIDPVTGVARYTPADPRELLPLEDEDWESIKQVALVGSADGATVIGVGLRERVPFFVETLVNEDGSGSRIYVDVLH